LPDLWRPRNCGVAWRGELSHNSPGILSKLTLSENMSPLLLIIIILLLVDGGGFYYGGPVYGGGGLGLVLVILLILFLTGSFGRRPKL
jgi:hypothetical protein